MEFVPSNPLMLAPESDYPEKSFKNSKDGADSYPNSE